MRAVVPQTAKAQPAHLQKPKSRVIIIGCQILVYAAHPGPVIVKRKQLRKGRVRGQQFKTGLHPPNQLSRPRDIPGITKQLEGFYEARARLSRKKKCQEAAHVSNTLARAGSTEPVISASAKQKSAQS